MAEAVARQVGGPYVEVLSAGVLARSVDPNYHALMAEIGIDTAGQESKTLDASALGRMDVVVTLCEPGKAQCPVPPRGVRHVNWEIPGWEAFSDDRLSGLRALRDEIRRHAETLIENLQEEWNRET